MRIVTISRKPCVEGSTTANVLRGEAGALNIDSCRIEGSVPQTTGQGFRTGKYGGQIGHGETTLDGVPWSNNTGRWPANVILSHRAGCTRMGMASVRSAGHYPGARPSGSQVSGPAGHKGQTALVERHMKGELVDVWDCSSDCPVADLDAQSGVSLSSGGRLANISKGQRVYGGGKGLGVDLPPEDVRGDPGYGDVGGASRYFKCFP